MQGRGICRGRGGRGVDQLCTEGARQEGTSRVRERAALETFAAATPAVQRTVCEA